MRISVVLLRVSRVLLVASLLGFGASSVSAQAGAAFRAEYTVAIKDTASQLFHVTATFSNLRQPVLQLALPIWTPGWYTLEYYGKNVRLFTARDGTGAQLATPLVRAQTWSIDTRGKDKVVVEFDYHAGVLALNQAKITSKYAFFTGTQLFLEPVGHRDTPSTVRFEVPEGWRVVSALHDTPDPNVFDARNYDDLVDAPAWLGAFDLHRFVVDGKPHLVVHGADKPLPSDTVRMYTEQLTNLVRTSGAIFGGLPYDKYVFFWLPDSAESGAAGGVEHANSFVVCCGGSPSLGYSSFTAHEFFHLWNVKRIRPAEHWPYDYSRPIETPSLWVSEGITSYYGMLIMHRAGLWPDGGVLGWLGAVIASIERNEERKHLSPSDASMSTWREYLSEPIGYYGTGAALGVLLDLSILHDTHGRRRLDDVMRALYHQFYERNKGFTPADLVRTVSAVAGRDYTDFFRRYVTGTERPPYEAIFGYAGVVTPRLTKVWGLLGGLTTAVDQGRRIDSVMAGGPAAAAGLRKGDVLLAIDDAPVERVHFFARDGCCILVEKGDERVVVTVMRGSQRMKVPLTLRKQSSAFFMEFDAGATPGQLTVRSAWLEKK